MNSWFKKAWPLLTLGVAVVALLGSFFVYFMGKDVSPGSGKAVTAQAETPEDLKGYEVIDVNVSNDGFEPNVIEVKSGVPTKINFILTRSVTHVKSVAAEKLGMDLYMQKGDNYYTVDQNVKPGEYELHCGMYMIYGTIKVI
ncbi:plastocyanin domain-containing protein [Paenibacillus sp. JGP012]|uniref:Cupredoxin domain-containing protein n=1 Tax=Paenibacillus silvae TaxID=1325358 RepID=A0A2W6P4B6_9BACL|nr:MULTISPECIES: cupredoxin domain-containing protein [Paenibacillus]MBB6024124.1 plastocyanin domain-containing protein [Paenibacillus sp. JGP012]MCK6073652.1 cupredoxin domain-containing protein [Paenibacillus silvae]MCK6148872.1 cupredoxin domain-containing protein [Paenibacillus silvae]MCK6267171.1 cupredoxin domain-containing protein [Paenibacillus silvae]PZT52996.1 cupredoxin domain-containing protein [Paenibacillus silvae]